MSERNSLNLNALVSEFIVYIESVRTLSPNSVIAYKNDLEYLEKFLGEKNGK